MFTQCESTFSATAAEALEQPYIKNGVLGTGSNLDILIRGITHSSRVLSTPTAPVLKHADTRYLVL